VPGLRKRALIVRQSPNIRICDTCRIVLLLTLRSLAASLIKRENFPLKIVRTNQSIEEVTKNAWFLLV